MVFKIIKVYEKYVNGLTYGESYYTLFCKQGVRRPHRNRENIRSTVIRMEQDLTESQEIRQSGKQEAIMKMKKFCSNDGRSSGYHNHGYGS